VDGALVVHGGVGEVIGLARVVIIGGVNVDADIDIVVDGVVGGEVVDVVNVVDVVDRTYVADVIDVVNVVDNGSVLGLHGRHDHTVRVLVGAIMITHIVEVGVING
jgi:hypothetical protein